MSAHSAKHKAENAIPGFFFILRYFARVVPEVIYENALRFLVFF